MDFMMKFYECTDHDLRLQDMDDFLHPLLEDTGYIYVPCRKTKYGPGMPGFYFCKDCKRPCDGIMEGRVCCQAHTGATLKDRCLLDTKGQAHKHRVNKDPEHKFKTSEGKLLGPVMETASHIKNLGLVDVGIE
jgi:hypothetical protein